MLHLLVLALLLEIHRHLKLILATRWQAYNKLWCDQDAVDGLNAIRDRLNVRCPEAQRRCTEESSAILQPEVDLLW